MGTLPASQASLTVFVTTIGRPSLEVTIQSFVTQAGPRDRMVVLGDGWTAPWVEAINGPARFVKKPHVGWFGFKHISDELDKGLETDYWSVLGDDDAYLPGAIEFVRRGVEGPVAVTKAVFVNPAGKVYIIPSVNIGSRSKKIVVGGWQTWYHKDTSVPRLDQISDAEAFRQVIAEIGMDSVTKLDKAPVVLKFPRLSQTWWDSLGFGKLRAFDPTLADGLAEESGIEVWDPNDA